MLVNAEPGNDLVTERKFTDFKLHAEFRYPRGSNSGIYLRGRYEVQIEDNFGEEPDSHEIGGIYGFLTPIANAAKKSGEWQTLEITLSAGRSRWYSTASKSSTARPSPESPAGPSTATKARPARSCCRAITARSSSES